MPAESYRSGEAGSAYEKKRGATSGASQNGVLPTTRRDRMGRSVNHVNPLSSVVDHELYANGGSKVGDSVVAG